MLSLSPICSFSKLLFPSLRRSHWILANSLPRKHEHVILVRMTDIQRSLMLSFLEKIRNDHENAHRMNPIILFSVFCKVSQVI